MIQWTYRRRFKFEQIEPGTKLKGEQEDGGGGAAWSRRNGDGGGPKIRLISAWFRMEYLKRISLRYTMTRREELWREGSLSYAGAARTRVGDSQRYSRKSNEREPNEAILKGDIVGSLGRRTNSITSSGIERRERGAKRRGQERRKRERESGWDRTKLCTRGREKCTMHSVHRYRDGLYCRNGSVEILDRLFSGSLDYDFTGLRFQYRCVSPVVVYRAIGILFEVINFLGFDCCKKRKGANQRNAGRIGNFNVPTDIE